MYSHRLAHLLVVVISMTCLAEASWPGLSIFARNLVVPRQEDSTRGSSRGTTTIAVAAAAVSSSDSDTERSPSSPTRQAATSRAAPVTSDEAPAQTSNAPARTSERAPQVTSADSPATRTRRETSATPPAQASSTADRPEKPTTTSSSSSPKESEDAASTATATPVVSTSIEFITRTNSDGSTMVSTATSKTTSTPGINAESNADTSGMSPKTRNTIIGVVVGVGGAIVLGALAFAAWRIWGRKKGSDDDDDLMDYSMPGPGSDKPERGSAAGQGPRSPFHSTLENYHQPTHVNASSNF